MVDVATLYRHRFSDAERIRKDAIWRVLCAEFFQKFVRPDRDVVLDIACGLGEFSRHIQARHRIGIDINPETAHLLPPDVEFHLGPADQMTGIPDASVDVCFSSNFLEHLPNKSVVDRVLAEILRVLKPGGTYVALQPNIRFCYDQYWDFYDHHTALSDRSCYEAFVQAGFEVPVLIPKFLPFTTKTKMPTHPFLVSLYLKFPAAWRLMGKQFLIVGKKSAI
jgi:ubiquinone/menaquinone biosynthesis C-methylase UbiE